MRNLLNYLKKYSSVTILQNISIYPPFVHAGWNWLGNEDERPNDVLLFTTDRNESEVYVMSFKKSDSGTEIGIFPFVSDSNNNSLITDWEREDGSIVFEGTYPKETLALTIPKVPENYIEGTLKDAGYPKSEKNIYIMTEWLSKSALLVATSKVKLFMPNKAEFFSSNHQFTGVPFEEYYYKLMNDLVDISSQAIPYIQQTLIRNRAIALEMYPEGYWKNLEM